MILSINKNKKYSVFKFSKPDVVTAAIGTGSNN
jgi:hypothetical protein